MKKQKSRNKKKSSEEVEGETLQEKLFDSLDESISEADRVKGDLKAIEQVINDTYDQVNQDDFKDDETWDTLQNHIHALLGLTQRTSDRVRDLTERLTEIWHMTSPSKVEIREAD